jgi:hypothetical protein
MQCRGNRIGYDPVELCKIDHCAFLVLNDIEVNDIKLCSIRLRSNMFTRRRHNPFTKAPLSLEQSRSCLTQEREHHSIEQNSRHRVVELHGGTFPQECVIKLVRIVDEKISREETRNSESLNWRCFRANPTQRMHM